MKSPIVGMHFRPPASIVLKHLRSGGPIILEAEPSNQYDSNAIKVLVPKHSIPASQELKDLLPGFGIDPEEFFESEEPLFLGYIARTDTEGWHNEMDGEPIAAILAFDASNKPIAQSI